MRHDVFVSYSKPDIDCAFELVSWIEREGISTWIAPRDVLPMSDWACEIIDAITSARVMILVLSASSNNSPQVRREVERAVQKQVQILPFRIDDVLPSKSLEYFVSSQHWLDAFPPPREPYYARLCTVLNTALAAVADVAATAAPAIAPSPSLSQSSAAVMTHRFTLDATELMQIDQRLAHYIGPVAKHLVRRAVSSAADVEDLTRKLASEIASESDRREFVRSCRQLRRQRT
jgi:xanthine/CO dehydrogenase XdhC/CoxF family maturation factor